jgi:hypothetical protein
MDEFLAVVSAALATKIAEARAGAVAGGAPRFQRLSASPEVMAAVRKIGVIERRLRQLHAPAPIVVSPHPARDARRELWRVARRPVATQGR